MIMFIEIVNFVDVIGFYFVYVESGVMVLDLLEVGEEVNLLFMDFVMSGGIDGWELVNKVWGLCFDLFFVFLFGYFVIGDVG